MDSLIAMGATAATVYGIFAIYRIAGDSVSETWNWYISTAMIFILNPPEQFLR